MGLLTFVGRIVLVVINIVFMLVATCLILLGFLLRFANDTLRPYVVDQLDSIKGTVQTLNPGTDFNYDNFDLGSLVGDLCTILIVGGLVLLAFAFVGCCGACCNLTTLLLVYAIVLIVLVVGQAALVGIAYGKPDLFVDYMEKGMNKTLLDYDGLNGTSASALGWNWAMQQYDCCGAESYSDFSDKYQTNDRLDGGTDVLTPLACCVTLPTDNAGKIACAGQEGATAISSLSSVNNYNTGCAQAVWDWATGPPNKTYLLLGVAFAFAFQIVLIIFAILGYKNRGVTGGLV